MRLFQVISFVVIVLFWMILAVFTACNPRDFLKLKKEYSIKKSKYEFMELSSYGRGRRKRIAPWEAIWFIVVIGIIIYLMRGYFLDIPQLITGKLNYVTGTVCDIETYRKDPTKYVYLDNGQEVKFFFESGVDKNKEYKIGYLSHTLRAIYCAELNGNNEGKVRELGFPFLSILGFLGIMAAMIFLMFISKFVRWKLFIPACIIFYPSCIYKFINYGLTNGIWFGKDNRGFVSLTIGVASSLTIAFVSFAERKRDGDNFITLFFVQMFALIYILMAAGLFLEI